MINAAIIGLGRWGRNLVESVHGKSDAIRFVAGAVRNVANAEAYTREKGFPLYDAYEKALADPGVDAVVLATPHTRHAEQIVAAAKAGKHVFTEKPLVEQGLADLRGLGPLERARTIIDRCAHPAYRPYLHDYLAKARVGHIRHDLGRAFELHRNLLETGQMLPDLDLSQFS